MDWLILGLTQTCTRWEKTGVDQFNQPSFAAPVQLICRMEQRTQKIQTNEGVEVMSRARIFLAEDVEVGDYIGFGTLAGSDPRIVTGAYRVLEFVKIPSLDGASFERKAYL